MHDFAAKRNALFACLDDASSELKGTLLDQSNSCTALRRTEYGGEEMNYRQVGIRYKHAAPERTLQHLRGKESIFKKPELPIARCLRPRKLPDYQVNPHKWKKYSLEDVDISDQTNSSAALEFLKQIDVQRGTAEFQGKFKEDQTKIEFKKSSKIRRNIKSLQSLEQMDAEVDSPQRKGFKLIMPEYIVGHKKKPTKKASIHVSNNNDKNRSSADKLLLSHLHEDYEDEDE